MTTENIHCIITGESGQGRSFIVSRQRLRKWIAFSAITLMALTGSGLLGLGTFFTYQRLKQKNQDLALQLEATKTSLQEQLMAANSTLATVTRQKVKLISQNAQILALQKEQENLLEGSISRLDERSKIIESIMDDIGVEMTIEEDPDHSGGPFISMEHSSEEKLLQHTDRYLEILQKIPLGRPISTRISSTYGKRVDPLNGKKSFHPGIDFRGRKGDKVYATGDAVVKIASSNKGLGKYIVLSHGYGYETTFAHLSKRLVKKGETITRGQVIGLVGNTGRSTGSHLHYELRHREKRIDPVKYMQLAHLSPQPPEQ